MLTRKVKLETLIQSDFHYSHTPSSRRPTGSASRSPIASSKSLRHTPKTQESPRKKPEEGTAPQSVMENNHKRGTSGMFRSTVSSSRNRLKPKKPSGDFFKKCNLDSLQLIERILSSATKKTQYEPYAAPQARSAAASPFKKPSTSNQKKRPKIKRRKLQRKSETPCEEAKEAPLVILQGEVVKKAPKLYKNQLFADVYDAMGNHDRVLDTSDCKDYDVIYSKDKLNIQPSIKGIIKQSPKCMNSLYTEEISNVTSELLNVLSFKPPENSYIEDSTKETPNVAAKYSKELDLIDQLNLLLTGKKKVCFKDSFESSASF
jgi:hypothetical protein